MKLILTLAIALAAALASARAGAQVCGANVSRCRTCHEAQAFLTRAAPWHRDHDFADLCTGCHAGDPAAEDAAGAHAALVAPATTCQSCHAANSAALIARYAAPRAIVPAPSIAPSRPREPAWANLVLTGIILVVAAAGSASIVHHERARGARPRPARASFTPYVTGAGLGVVVTVSLAIFGHRLSGSGPYQQLSAPIGRWLAPDNVYFTHVVATGLTWEILVLLGMLGGALASALIARQFRVRLIPDAQWTEVFGPSVWKRWLIVFAGTMVLEIAAGIAGGCTASLAVSGGAALAPGAFAFMAGMFGGGIPVARLLYRRGRR